MGEREGEIYWERESKGRQNEEKRNRGGQIEGMGDKGRKRERKKER